MGELTKTLELKLVDPTVHKRQKLRETRSAYQQALQEAFTAGCGTRSAANDVVIEYDLSGYAKNALKKYVPQLCGNSYDANELHNDHPVRFTNEGLQLDHQPQNSIEWYVKIPHHEDYHLWVPAHANPDQREWLEAVYADDAEMGESRLFERDGTWYLHVTATRNVADQSATTADERTPGDAVESPEPCLAALDRTPIGVDIGEASLVTVSRKSKISDESSKTRSVFEMSPRRERFSCSPRIMGRRRQGCSSAPQNLLHRHETPSEARQ